MRTTIYISDDILRSARKRAVDSGRTLTRFIEDSLRAALAQPKHNPARRKTIITKFKGGGLLPGVDLDNNAELLELMELKR